MHHEYHDPNYVSSYRNLYVADNFWAPKYQCNEKIISAILRETLPEVWLDLFCGQAQYFGFADDSIHCIGIDLSMEQLKIAKAKYPESTFLIRDISSFNLGKHLTAVPFISVMWGAYAYLPGVTQLRAVLKNISLALCNGGVFYVEIIEPSSLSQFNETHFASGSKATVCNVSDKKHYTRWTYVDHEQVHCLFCPSLKWFLQELQQIGLEPHHLTTVQTLHQVIAIKR